MTGGGVYFDSIPTVVFTDCIFSSNSALDLTQTSILENYGFDSDTEEYILLSVKSLNILPLGGALYFGCEG
jgi:hypothetical protein